MRHGSGPEVGFPGDRNLHPLRHLSPSVGKGSTVCQVGQASTTPRQTGPPSASGGLASSRGLHRINLQVRSSSASEVQLDPMEQNPSRPLPRFLFPASLDCSERVGMGSQSSFSTRRHGALVSSTRLLNLPDGRDRLERIRLLSLLGKRPAARFRRSSLFPSFRLRGAQQ